MILEVRRARKKGMEECINRVDDVGLLAQEAALARAAPALLVLEFNVASPQLVGRLDHWRGPMQPCVVRTARSVARGERENDG